MSARTSAPQLTLGAVCGCRTPRKCGRADAAFGRGLAGRLCDAFDFVALSNRERLGVVLGGLQDLVGKALADRLRALERGLGRTHRDVAQGDIDGLRDVDATVAQARDFLTGGSVDDGRDEDLDGVLLGLLGDTVEGELDGGVGLGLLALVGLAAHQVVHEALDDVDLHLGEALVAVAGRVVHDTGRLEADVLREAGVRDHDLVGRELAEDRGLGQVDLLRRGRGHFGDEGLEVAGGGFFAHANHLMGFSTLPLTSMSSETLLTLMTL